MNYNDMTVDELQEYADKNNIDLNGAKRKAAIIRAIEATVPADQADVELVDKDNEPDPVVEVVPEPETNPETEPEKEEKDAPKPMKIRALRGGLSVGGNILKAGSVYPVSERVFNMSAEDQKKAYGVVYYEKA